MPETYVVAGANLAGGTAAATLRGDGFEGRVVLDAIGLWPDIAANAAHFTAIA